MKVSIAASLFATLAALSTGGLAAAQSNSAPGLLPPDAATVAVAVNPRADNFKRMQRRVTVELTDARLEDAVQFISDYTGAEIEVLWADSGSAGLDKDQRINVAARELPSLTLLERVIERAQSEFDENTWQFSSTGAIEIGPKSLLNKDKVLKIYDIQDLLFVIPNFLYVPDLDLDSVLQQGQSGGGGGGGSILQDDQQDNQQNQETDEQAAQRLINIIVENVEPTQWQDNGGDGGTITFHGGNLLIRAPDYIHRQLQPDSFMTARPRAAAPASANASGDRTITNHSPALPAQAHARETPPASGTASSDAPKTAPPASPTGSGTPTQPATPAKPATPKK